MPWPRVRPSLKPGRFFPPGLGQKCPSAEAVSRRPKPRVSDIIVTGKDLNEIVTRTNSELKKVCTWFRANRLSLHPEKTKFMVFSNNENLIDFEEIDLYLDYNNPDQNDPNLVKKLSYVNSKSDIPAIKFLGFFLDCNLNFKYHIQAIRKKISKSLYIMQRCSNILSEKSLTMLYYSLVHCHLLYCNEIWSCGLPSSYKCLFIQQKKAIRIVTKSRYNQHTEPLFKRKEILPLYDLINLSKIKFMFDYKHSRAPSSFNNIWQRHAERATFNDYNLRQNSSEYYVEISRYKKFENFPLYAYSKIWNDIDEIFTEIPYKKIFLDNIKSHLFEKLEEHVQCTRLFCQSCQNL